jgi:hypothetical protein
MARPIASMSSVGRTGSVVNTSASLVEHRVPTEKIVRLVRKPEPRNPARGAVTCGDDCLRVRVIISVDVLLFCQCQRINW